LSLLVGIQPGLLIQNLLDFIAETQAGLTGLDEVLQNIDIRLKLIFVGF
jgi:hypothetical protein